jgi:cell wall-associated NlpC family hydrolase
MTTKEIQDYVWNWLRNKGLNEKATAGIMGNISQESSWDATEIEAGSGIGFGLCQWSYTRRTQIEAYGTDLDHQLEFLWSEMTGENLSITGAELQWYNKNGFTYSEFSAGNYSPSQSASAFCWCWERPNALDAKESYRQSQAEVFYSTYQGSSGSTNNNAQKVENAVLWLIAIANDETHGYDQDNRWSPDYDCSSFVISGFEQAGIPLKTNGATYTGDMKNAAINTGFTIVNWNNDVNNLVRGDILLNETHHTCVYIGNGQIVQASINELGTVRGGQTGDQTGKEIYVRSYYDYTYGWDCVLRYGSGSIGNGSSGTGGTGGVPSDDTFDDNYFNKYESYFEKYDDLSEVYKKLIETPYIMKQLSANFIKFLRTLNFNDNCHMKFTFDRTKRQIGQNYLGNKLTFDNKEYKIKDVRSNGFFVINYGGSECYNFINPKYIYQTSNEQAETKSENVAKIKQHIQDEIDEAQAEKEEQTL